MFASDRYGVKGLISGSGRFIELFELFYVFGKVISMSEGGVGAVGDTLGESSLRHTQVQFV